MIQRIQSIYLLLATALMAIFLFIPFAHLGVDNPQTFSVQGFSTSDGVILHTWGIFVLGAVITLIDFMAIFLYKNRPAQMRLCKINMLFTVCLYATIGLYFYLTDLAVTLLPAIAIPAVALVFSILAHRAINRDERLVRSLDRIR